MTKEQSEKIQTALEKTSIPEEMNAVYLLANSVDMMCYNTLNRIKSVYRANGWAVQESEPLAYIRSYCDMVRRAVLLFNQKIEPHIIGATFGTGEKGDVEGYDGFQDDSRELCRLILKYLDRTALSRESAEKVFQMLEEMPSEGLFSENDIKRYERK